MSTQDDADVKRRLSAGKDSSRGGLRIEELQARMRVPQLNPRRKTMKWGEKASKTLGVRGLYVLIAVTLLAVLSGAHWKWC